MYEQEDTSWGFAIGLFVGAIAGAALASLFTPRSGPQNRELVLEKGLVLKERVTDATASVATSVKGTTQSAVTSVKETTHSAVESVKETTHSAVEGVKDATNTAVSKVSDTVSTVKDAASTAAEKVSDAASTTVSTVKDAASSAAEKVSDATSTAAEKARELTGRSHDAAQATTELPSATELASEARYDAEDVRPATTAPTATIISKPNVSLTPTTSEEQTTYAGTAPTTGGTSAAAKAATRELASPEQFEVADTDVGASSATQPSTSTSTVAGTNADVREASEGAERNG